MCIISHKTIFVITQQNTFCTKKRVAGKKEPEKFRLLYHLLKTQVQYAVLSKAHKSSFYDSIKVSVFIGFSYGPITIRIEYVGLSVDLESLANCHITIFKVIVIFAFIVVIN